MLSCASLAALHSDCSSTKLCAVSAKKWKEVRVERRGQHGSLYELLVCSRATAFDMMGFLPHFPFFVFLFEILLLLDFSFFLYLFPSPFPSFPLCLCVPSTLFIFSFSLFSPYPPTFVKPFKFLLLLEIFLLFLSISSPISFLSLFPAVLPKLLLFLTVPGVTQVENGRDPRSLGSLVQSSTQESPFLLCLIFSSLLSSALPPSPYLPNPLSIIPYLWLQVLQLQESETLPGWGGSATCIAPTLQARGGGCCVCRSRDNGSCQQDVGVLCKCGNVP